MVVKYDLMVENNEESLTNRDKLRDIRTYYEDFNREIHLRYCWGEDPAKPESYIPRIFDEINIECDNSITLDIIKKAEKHLKKKIVKELTKLRDNLKKYMTNV